MRIGIGSDHAGFGYKEMFKAHLKGLGHDVKDFGTDSEQPVDYPLFCRPVAEAVAAGETDRGIVIGGSGNGEAMTANRVRGVRAALCWDVVSAELGRHHNDANVLSVGARMVSEELAIQILDAWLNTPFDGGRHVKRIEEIDAFDDGRAASQLPGVGTPMKLYTYLNYGGNCRQAFEFYAEHLGGIITVLMTHGEQAGLKDVPNDFRDAVLHARIEIGGTMLLGTDVPPDHFEPIRSAYLSLLLDSAAEAERIFTLLAEAGQIFMPMQETFFADRFAMLRDRFGTSWMLLHERTDRAPIKA